MNMNAVSGSLRQVWIPFFTPVPRALRRVEAEFRKGARVVQVKGYPKKVFCVHQPEDNAALLRDREVGEIKFPGLLPRVKHAMRTGGYILEGGPEWRDRRRQVIDAFRADQLKRYAAQIPAKVQEAFSRWTRTGAISTMDVAEEMRLLVTAVNLKMFFSDDAQFDRLKSIMHWTHFIEYRLVGVVPLSVPTPTNRRLLKYLDALREEFTAMARARAASPGDQRDLFSVLLAAQPKEALARGNVDAVVDESFSVYFGASVMAVSLAWALYYLAKDRELQNKLRADIKTWLSANGNDPSALLTSPECDSAVKEILRQFPASWGYPRHCRKGMELGGVRIPPGSLVIPMIEYTHHDPTLWQDTERFCPARFAGVEGKSNTSNFAYLPFGLGTRTCLGHNLAPIVLKTILGMMLDNFEVSPTGETPARIEPSYGFEIQPPGPIPLTLRHLA